MRLFNGLLLGFSELLVLAAGVATLLLAASVAL